MYNLLSHTIVQNYKKPFKKIFVLCSSPLIPVRGKGENKAISTNPILLATQINKGDKFLEKMWSCVGESTTK